jgi:glycosyltransferase involved in cell wall biosynthesis
MISICIAVYNGSEFLLPQLLSVLPQLGIEDEIIVVNDCSTDNSLDVLNSVNDSRIKIIENSANMGVLKSFEAAITASSGDYIFLCDQDDVWMPGKIETCMKKFESSDVLLIVSDAYVMSEDKIMIDTFYQTRGSKPGFIRNIIKNSFIGCCMAFQKELKQHILPFPESIPMHDQWIGLVAEMHSHVEFIPERLLIYRRHSNNVTQLNTTTLSSIVKKRFAIVKMFYEYFRRRSATS